MKTRRDERNNNRKYQQKTYTHTSNDTREISSKNYVLEEFHLHTHIIFHSFLFYFLFMIMGLCYEWLIKNVRVLCCSCWVAFFFLFFKFFCICCDCQLSENGDVQDSFYHVFFSEMVQNDNSFPFHFILFSSTNIFVGMLSGIALYYRCTDALIFLAKWILKWYLCLPRNEIILITFFIFI